MNVKILIDTNVLLDAFTERDNFSTSAKELLRNVSMDKYDTYISSKTVLDFYYLYHHYSHSKEIALNCLKMIVDMFQIIEVNSDDLRFALESEVNDYEDAVLIEGAKRYDIDLIITRNQHHYKDSPIKSISPNEFLN
mgnify:CR=1 FL=1